MRAWTRFFRQTQNIVGLLLIALFVGTAVFAPWLSPQPDPTNPTDFKSVGQNFDRTPRPPNPENLLGTTPDMPPGPLLPGISQPHFGNQWDVFHTLVWGTRQALRFGLTVTFLTATFGILWGAVSGYIGGFFNGFAMRLTDAFLTFPPIAAIWLFQRLFFTTILANPFDTVTTQNPWLQFWLSLNLTPVMLALIVFSWMPYARLINAQIIQLKRVDYVMAAQALGASHFRILFRHLLPNAIAPVIVLAAKDIGTMVILESAFTFIGISGTIPWGIMLVASRDYILGFGGNPFVYWWVFVPISVAIILFAMGWNLLGDGLNSAFNPRTASR